jgi:hypothetical protein
MHLEKVKIEPDINLNRDAWVIEPYFYVRFRWARGLDFNEIVSELRETFQVEELSRPFDEKEISPYKYEREKLKVRADTLGALLSPFRAVLYQREPAKFTATDMKLRKRILELYPRITATFLPWHFSVEPKFMVAEETNE